MILRMAKNKAALPADFYDSEDDEYYVNESLEKIKNDVQKENDAKIKIIKSIGSEAGLNKSNFDVQLHDSNSRQWFDQIYQYWRQCKCFSDDSHSAINSAIK